MGISAAVGVGASGLPVSGDRANSVVSGALTAVAPGKPFAVRGPMNMMAWGSFKSALTTAVGSLNATVASAGAIAAGQSVNSINVPPGTTVASIVGANVVLALPTQTYYAVLSGGTAMLTMAVDANGASLPGTLSTLVGATIASPYFGTGVTVLGVGAVAGTLLLSAAPTSLPALGGQVPIEFALTANAITVAGADANALFTGAGIVFNATLQIERSFDGGLTFLPANIGGAGQLAQFTLNTPVSLTFGEPELGVLYRWNATVFAAVTGVTLNYRISTTGEAATALAVGAQI